MTSFSRNFVVLLAILASLGRCKGIEEEESCACREGLAPPTIPNVILSNGVEMPILALGTAPLQLNDQAVPALPHHPTFHGMNVEQNYRNVQLAFEMGMRHIDTGYLYRSHSAIGHVLGNLLATGQLERKNVFLTTKVMHGPPDDDGKFSPGRFYMDLDRMTPEEVAARIRHDVEQSLTDLGVGYVDLLLLHWPAAVDSQSPDNRARRIAAYEVLEDFYRKGWARAIGVSNYNEHHLKQLAEDGATIGPHVNQIEASVFLQYEGIVQYCKQNDIVLESYSPLGRGVNGVTEHPLVREIAQRYKKDAGQVAMRYLIQLGYAVTFLSTSERRLKSNQQLFDFVLSEDDMAALAKLQHDDGSWGLPSPYGMA